MIPFFPYLLDAGSWVTFDVIVLTCPPKDAAKIAQPMVGLRRVAGHGHLSWPRSRAALSDNVHQSANYAWTKLVNYHFAKLRTVFQRVHFDCGRVVSVMSLCGNREMTEGEAGFEEVYYVGNGSATRRAGALLRNDV